jgi:hypothetical protein
LRHRHEVPDVRFSTPFATAWKSWAFDKSTRCCWPRWSKPPSFGKARSL